MSATSLMTWAEFAQLPEVDGEKHELVNGEFIILPPPELNHTEIAKTILFILADHLGRKRVWPDKTGYRIGGGWLEPDVSVSWPDQRRDEKYFLGSPMIAIEVLSPGEEIEEKLTLYFQDGASEVWVINPRKKTMSAYAKQSDSILRYAVDREYHSAGIGATISLAEIFA